MKGILKKTIFLLLGGGVALAAPVVPQDAVWIKSYGDETTGKYVHVFERGDGSLYETQTDEADYDRLAEPNAPQPTSTTFSSVLGALQSEAAIAVDAENASSCNTCTSLTYALNIPTNNNTLLAVTATRHDTTAADRVLASIKYNSVDLSQIRTDENTGANISSDIWYLAGPSTGTSYNIVVTGNASTISALQSHAIALTGAAQSSIPDAQNGFNSDNTQNPSFNVVSTVADTYLVSAASMGGATCNVSNFGPGGTWTLINSAEYCGGTGRYGAGSYKAGSTAGNQSVDWSGNSASADWAIAGVAFAPYVAPPAGGTPVYKDDIMWFGSN